MPIVIRLATFLLIFCAVTAIEAASPSELIREGNEAYRNKLFDKSIQSYRKALEQAPTSPIVQYNLGTALAQKGDLDESMAVLGQAADSSEGEMRAKSLYNLGVTMTEETEKSQDPEPSKQIAGLKQALGSFKQAVLENPLDYEAKHNYEVLLKRIKQMEQQQQQGDGDGNQDQEQKNDGNQNQQQNQNQDGQGKPQGQGDSENKDQPRESQDPSRDQQDGQDEQQEQKEQQNSSDEGEQEEQEPKESGSGQGEGQMTPSQMDAQRLLNLLEQQDSDQFKKVFQGRGKSEQPPKKAW